MVVGGRDGSVASRGRLKSFVMCAKRDPIKMSKAPIIYKIHFCVGAIFIQNRTCCDRRAALFLKIDRYEKLINKNP